MAQKKSPRDVEEEESSSFLSRFLTNLKDTVLSNVVGTIKDNIKEKVERVEKKVIRCINSYIFFFLGVISLAISLVLALEFYFNLNLWWGFLICGLLFLLISVILRVVSKRD